VNSRAVLAGIFAALAATLSISRYTHGRGLWVLSPQAIGIVTACVVVGLITIWAMEKKSGDPVI
jgi:SSS family solute:Na+ symporter